MEIIQKLISNNFKAVFFENSEDAKKAALLIIGSSDVGIGGSVTVEKLGIYEELVRNGNNTYWHWRSEDKAEAHKKAALCPVYLSGANAVTENGTLVNIDGTGNRIASLMFGHETVIVFAGINKLTGTAEDAVSRIKSTACPLNAKRLGLKTPCSMGVCTDCSSPQRMCNVSCVLDKAPNGIKNFYVFIINENLGY